MRYIFSLFGLLALFVSGSHISQDTGFLQMSHTCWVDSNKTYTCNDMDTYISYDPFMDEDVKYVCKNIKTGNYTNDNFASLANFRLKSTGFTACYVKSINNLGKVQLKKQCPSIYKDYCESVVVK
jgi:hypothetical protein